MDEETAQKGFTSLDTGTADGHTLAQWITNFLFRLPKDPIADDGNKG
jgi:hypothetical protein